MTQQYTCPYCFEDYTQFTIHEHYGCGVEPLETTEDIKAELDSISEEVAIQESGEVQQFSEEEIEEAKSAQKEPLEINEIKPEPKKRGRKPKGSIMDKLKCCKDCKHFKDNAESQKV